MVEKNFRFEATSHWKMVKSVDAPHMKKPICATSQPLGNTLDLSECAKTRCTFVPFCVHKRLRGLHRPCAEPKMVQKCRRSGTESVIDSSEPPGDSRDWILIWSNEWDDHHIAGVDAHIKCTGWISGPLQGPASDDEMQQIADNDIVLCVY